MIQFIRRHLVGYFLKCHTSCTCKTSYTCFRANFQQLFRNLSPARREGCATTRSQRQGVILHDWLTESGITNAEQLEVTAAPGVLRLQRREVDVFRA